MDEQEKYTRGEERASGRTSAVLLKYSCIKGNCFHHYYHEFIFKKEKTKKEQAAEQVQSC